MKVILLFIIICRGRNDLLINSLLLNAVVVVVLILLWLVEQSCVETCCLGHLLGNAVINLLRPTSKLLLVVGLRVG